MKRPLVYLVSIVLDQEGKFSAVGLTRGLRSLVWTVIQVIEARYRITEGFVMTLVGKDIFWKNCLTEEDNIAYRWRWRESLQPIGPIHTLKMVWVELLISVALHHETLLL